jgi:hypothetical protein
MTTQIQISANTVQRFLIGIVKWNSVQMEVRAGLEFWSDRQAYLVGAKHGELPYRVLMTTQGIQSGEWDFQILIDPRRFLATGFDMRNGVRQQIPVIIRGRHLSALESQLNPEDRDLSRLIGAIGGEAAGMMAGAKIGVIGCGGIGSAIVGMLAQGGCQNLVLMDEDVLELSNLHRMPLALTEDDIGRSKVVAMADLAARVSGSRPQVFLQSFQSINSRLPLRDLDLLIVATDNVASRRLAASFAAGYLIPAIGVGTGVFNEGRVVEIGFALPGDGCLTCVQNLPKDGNFDFGVGRAGSLASLNSAAAGIAVGLIEDFAMGKVESSLSLRYVWDNGLRLVSSPRRNSWCDCAQSTGIGDFGLRVA